MPSVYACAPFFPALTIAKLPSYLAIAFNKVCILFPGFHVSGWISKRTSLFLAIRQFRLVIRQTLLSQTT